MECQNCNCAAWARSHKGISPERCSCLCHAKGTKHTATALEAMTNTSVLLFDLLNYFIKHDPGEPLGAMVALRRAQLNAAIKQIEGTK